MKYYLSLICLVALSSCTSAPKSFICMSALTPLGGIQVDTSNPQVKELSSSLELTTPNGAKIIVPKGLCVEVKGDLQ